MERPTDAELMTRVRDGDGHAFAEVVNRHKDAMVNYLTRLAGSRARAEDLAQEAFLRLYELRDRYQEMGRLSGFLYRIATNLTRSDNRREMRRKLLRLAFLSGDNGDRPQESPQRELLRGEAQRKVSEAIERVPLRYRAPLVLHAIEGLPYEEIARVLGCREGTVKSRISRARGMLKKKLAPYVIGGAP